MVLCLVFLVIYATDPQASCYIILSISSALASLASSGILGTMILKESEKITDKE